jgi:MFS family permease
VTRHDGANGGAPRPGLRGLGSAWFVVALFVAQRFARGMLTVLLVAAAIDLLGMGVAGVGLLGAAIGFGGLVGGVVAVGLIGRRRLAPAFVGAAVLWGVAVLMPGVIAIPAAALAFLAAGGLGKVVLDVSGFTLLQRTVPDDLRGRVLGILEGLVTAALALGSVVAAALIETLGPAGALIVGGAVPLVAAAITGPALARADDAAVVPEAELRLLRAVPMFRPLDLSTLEHLAGALRREEIPAGHDVVREGELGERFYIVESGTFEALVDGRLVRTLGPLDSFGEIALLRDIPRTATVRAIEDGVVASVEREHFLSAVSSHRESSDAAEDVIRSRLGD